MLSKSMKNKIFSLEIIAFISISMLSVLFQVIPVKGLKHQKTATEGRVFLLTNRVPKEQSAVYISLGLDNRLDITLYGVNDDAPGAIQNINNYNFSNYDVVVVDCYLPQNATDRLFLRSQILANNLGLLFFGGNYTMGMSELADLLPAHFSSDKDYLNETVGGVLIGTLNGTGIVGDYLNLIYNNTKEVNIMRDQIQVAVAKEEQYYSNGTEKADSKKTIFSKNIAWQSCPLLRERVFTFARKEKARTLVEVPNTQEPLVVVANLTDIMTTTSNASVIFISTGVGNITFYEDTNGKVLAEPEKKEMNTPFKLWPYFNYFMYLCAFYLDVTFDKNNLETYAEWPKSPIPHEREATLWMIFVASLWIFNFGLFFSLGKKKKAKDLLNAQKNDVKPEGNGAATTMPPKEVSTEKPDKPAESTPDQKEKMDK